MKGQYNFQDSHLGKINSNAFKEWSFFKAWLEKLVIVSFSQLKKGSRILFFDDKTTLQTEGSVFAKKLPLSSFDSDS